MHTFEETPMHKTNPITWRSKTLEREYKNAK